MSKNNIFTFVDGLVQTKEIWIYGGYLDVKQKYRRTKFGPFWNTLIIGIFLMGLGPVYSTIFGTDLKDFFPYLSVGFIIWIFFSSTLNENLKEYGLEGTIIIKLNDNKIKNIEDAKSIMEKRNKRAPVKMTYINKKGKINSFIFR